jgi:hypothetical protein
MDNVGAFTGPDPDRAAFCSRDREAETSASRLVIGLGLQMITQYFAFGHETP